MCSMNIGWLEVLLTFEDDLESTIINSSMILSLWSVGGKTQADRTHVKREENFTGGQLPLPRQT